MKLEKLIKNMAIPILFTGAIGLGLKSGKIQDYITNLPVADYPAEKYVIVKDWIGYDEFVTMDMKTGPDPNYTGTRALNPQVNKAVTGNSMLIKGHSEAHLVNIKQITESDKVFYTTNEKNEKGEQIYKYTQGNSLSEIKKLLETNPDSLKKLAINQNELMYKEN